jgi:hypothetical protein
MFCLTQRSGVSTIALGSIPTILPTPQLEGLVHPPVELHRDSISQVSIGAAGQLEQAAGAAAFATSSQIYLAAEVRKKKNRRGHNHSVAPTLRCLYR